MILRPNPSYVPSYMFPSESISRGDAWLEVVKNSPLSVELQGRQFVIKQHHWRKDHEYQKFWRWEAYCVMSVEFLPHAPEGFVPPPTNMVIPWSWCVWNDPVTGETCSGLRR